MATEREQAELVDSGARAWNALSRAIRTVTLYDAEHAQVLPWLERAVQGLHRCCDFGEPVVFELKHDDLLLDGVSIARRAAIRTTLLSRMHADGLRQIHVRSGIDVKSAGRFADALAPYQNPAQAPLDSVADRLHWQPLGGLTFVIHARGTITGDATTAAQQGWRRRLLDARVMPGPEHLPKRTRLASVWDGTGGRVPWPPPVLPDAIRALEQELEEADRVGVPVLRIGRILVAVLEMLAGRANFPLVLEQVEATVDHLLANDLPDEASHLLQPMARWAGRPGRNPTSDAARREARDFLGLLVTDERLGLLLRGAQRGLYTPEQLAAWFAAVPTSSLLDLLRFAAAVPVGPHRQALLGVAAYLCRHDSAPLEQVIATGRAGPALLALEVSASLESPAGASRVVQIALKRTEQAVLMRAFRVAEGLDDAGVHRAVLEVLQRGAVELRSVALRHVARHGVVAAAALLEDYVASAQFGQRPLSEQLIIAQTFGATSGGRCVDLARRRLGPHWGLGEPDRAAPWILCLAAAEVQDAAELMEWLQGRAGARLGAMIDDARGLLAASRRAGGTA